MQRGDGQIMEMEMEMEMEPQKETTWVAMAVIGTGGILLVGKVCKTNINKIRVCMNTSTKHEREVHMLVRDSSILAYPCKCPC